MILVFVGAGASSAVSTQKYPTTIEYFNKLESSIKNSALFQVAVRDIEEKSEPLDIENVLFRLGLLDTQLKQRNHISEYSDFYDLVLESCKLRPELSNLIDQINRKVFAFYGQVPEKSELENNWLKLFQTLMNSGQKFEIVTTNYDTNIETALEIFGDKPNLKLTDGFKKSPGQGEELDFNLWQKFEADREQGLITKLHGSVSWFGDRNNISRIKPRFQNKDAHPIIYPGFKGDPKTNKNIHPSFHQYFQTMIPSVTHALFIGFAFRDEYINSLLTKINRSCKITNIGFGIEPPNIPVHLKNSKPEDGYIFLEQGFGPDAVAEFEARLN